MGITNAQTGTRVDEIADGIYRISTPFPGLPGGFSFNQYSHTKNARPLLARLAAATPTTLACMHGSAWHGDGSHLLEALVESLDP
jgi:hypothetical protein